MAKYPYQIRVKDASDAKAVIKTKAESLNVARTKAKGFSCSPGPGYVRIERCGSNRIIEYVAEIKPVEDVSEKEE